MQRSLWLDYHWQKWHEAIKAKDWQTAIEVARTIQQAKET